jgi:glutathione S-transferase
MITLYQFRPVWGLPNASPFCMKLETYLRMVELPYQVARNADVRKAPKKKFPYIDDDGKVIADSGFIIDYLKATYGDPLDQALTPAQQAQVLAMRRLFEEHLYWAMVHDRWIVPENWRVTRRAFFGFMPAAVRPVIATLVRGKTRKKLLGHGMGLHSTAEIEELGKADLSAASAFLGDKAYFMGEQPSSLDATAYAFLANAVRAPFNSPLTIHARSLTNVAPYCERMRLRYFNIPAREGHMEI